MDQIKVALVGEPHRLEGFVEGFGARIAVSDGSGVREVRLLASATDFHVLGASQRETDPVVWVKIGRLAGAFIARTYGSLQATPAELRVATILEL